MVACAGGWTPVSSVAERRSRPRRALHHGPRNGLESLAAGVKIEVFVPGGELMVDGFDRGGAARNMWTIGFRHQGRRQ
ncbi:MAG TPA: hypothetical protein VHE35_30985, partial [Kofleriaceae bacterium]|nr:hypothetical protein [Kofleriaceae bacterium]